MRPISDDEAAALAAITASCRAVVRAEESLNEAIVHRFETVRRLWPTIYRFGPKWLSTEIGDDLITDTNLRNITSKMTPRPRRGPFAGEPPTIEEVKAIGELTGACRTVVDAKERHRKALDQRTFAIRDNWHQVERFGFAPLARLIGDDLVGESTIRSAVAELKRQRGE